MLLNFLTRVSIRHAIACRCPTFAYSVRPLRNNCYIVTKVGYLLEKDNHRYDKIDQQLEKCGRVSVKIIRKLIQKSLARI